MVVGQVPTVPTEPHWRTQRQTMRAEDLYRGATFGAAPAPSLHMPIIRSAEHLVAPPAFSPRMPIIRSAEHLVRGPFSPTNNVPRGFPF